MQFNADLLASAQVESASCHHCSETEAHIGLHLWIKKEQLHAARRYSARASGPGRGLGQGLVSALGYHTTITKCLTKPQLTCQRRQKRLEDIYLYSGIDTKSRLHNGPRPKGNNVGRYIV